MKYFLGLALLFSVHVAKAQDTHVLNTRHMLWTCALGEYKFNDKWSAWLDAQFRYEYTNGDGEIFQWCVRPSVMRKLKNGLLLSLGTSYFALYPYPNEKPPRQDIRLWQEVGYKFKPDFHHTIYPRARLEQRFIREYAGDVLADEFTFNAFRLRLRVDYTYAIGKETAGPWFLLAGDELFLFQKTNGFSGFDQNRTWAGIGYKLNANHNIQLSYLYLYLQRNSRVADQLSIARILYQFTIAPKPKEKKG